MADVEARAGVCDPRDALPFRRRRDLFAVMTLVLSLLSVLLELSCRQIVGIKPRRQVSFCDDRLTIDSLEDGDEFICRSAGRDGNWFAQAEGTSANLDPAPGQVFTPTPIAEGRGTSNYAARLKGSGYDWALMGFTFDVEGLAAVPYDVGMTDGIKFWMKSNAAVSVDFITPQTLPERFSGGTCTESTTDTNCYNHFSFQITAPDPNSWVEYLVPFDALAQPGEGGSAKWDRSRILGVNFAVKYPGAAFDVWVDDIGFYVCSGNCLPTCSDPAAPVSCRAIAGFPSGCRPAGADCLPPLVDFYDVRGVGPGDVWAVGDRGITVHWNGYGWSAETSRTTNTLQGVWGSGSADVWAFGEGGTIVRWNGFVWSAVTSGTKAPLLGAWGSGPNDVWAVGLGGTIVHWNGSAWSAVTQGATPILLAAWGSGSNDVWAVGDGGTIVHWNGSAWSVSPSGTTETLFGVWGSGPSDVWAVGDFDTRTIVHWDGSAWSPFTTDGTTQLVGVWGSGPNDVWAVGHGGTIVHWNGSAWSAAVSGITQRLESVWGSGPNDVWAAGRESTIVHWNGSAWSRQSIPRI